MQWSHPVRPLARLVAFAALASLASAGVRIVDASGAGDFTTIQAAVDAASDGDVILVRGGTYPSVTIVDKALAIYADVAADARISGRLEVSGLAAQRILVVSGLDVTGRTLTPAPEIALTLTDNSGALRFQDCTFRGGNGLPGSGYPMGPGASGVRLVNDPNVAFARCVVIGGNGFTDSTSCFDCTGGLGGDGLWQQGSTVALYDCQLTGGHGGEAGEYGGRGGNGCRSVSLGGFASRTTFRGGNGGNAWDFLDAHGGHGGNGLQIDAGSTFHLLSCPTYGGAGGIAYLFPSQSGAAGAPIFGSGTLDPILGASRVFLAGALAESGGSVAFTVYGQPGDRVFLTSSRSTAFRFHPASSGVWLTRFPAAIAVDPLGIVPPSGILNLVVPLQNLPGGTDAGVLFLQGLVIDTAGRVFLGSPNDVLRLRCGSLVPDCNGNGAFDTCDLLRATSIDCDVNGIPDECQPDCNGNGVADSCDISAGTSSDENHDGIPDECQTVAATRWVDAAAAPGGDGTAALPFRTIGEGVAVSLTGDTVIVRDGVYSGAGNRNLDFTGRDIVVRSEHGPAGCIVDCQAASRAFTFRSGETPTALLQGFTIRNGSSPGSSFEALYGGAIDVWTSSPTIQGCVFTNCSAREDGGAMYLFDSGSLVRDCTFDSNSVTNHGNAAGGAVECVHSGVRIVGCLFTNNHSPRYGGALSLFPTAGLTMLVSNCSFLANSTAQYSGGAVYMSAMGGIGAQFEGCLFAGNSAAQGGALAGNGTIVLRDSTLVGNLASMRGGAIDRDLGGQGTLVNSIVWGNAAPLGAQISLTGSSAAMTVQRCDVQGGSAGVAVDPGAVLTWGAGNLSLDPVFVSPAGPDGNPLTVGDNDYRLSLASPCIDAGDNALVGADVADQDRDGNTSEPLPYDLDHLPRFRDVPAVPDTGSGTPPIVDLGAYERQP